MTRFLRRVSGIAAILLLAASFPPGDASAAETKKPAESGLYAKKGTWAETLLASRAQYAQWETEKSKQAGHPGFQPFDSGTVSGDGPARHISVNVAGLDTMRLTVNLEGGSGNCSIWGEAKLIAKDGTETQLSSLRPVAIKVGWGSLVVNKNWQDHPLQIGDKKFQHGIWAHTDSDVCYALARKYERFDAWIGMDADRATGAARFKVLSGLPDLLPAIWQNVAQDFPAQAKWLIEDAAQGQHMRWFAESNSVRFEQGIIGHVVGQVGPAADPLRKDLADLAAAKTPPTDPSWLNLYARACRAREAFASVKQVPLAELRSPLEQQLAELSRAKTPSEDPRWAELQGKADRFRSVLGPIQQVSLDTLRPSIDDLAKAFPTRFSAKAGLLNELAAGEQSWKQILAAAVQGDQTALGRIPELRKQVTALQRSVRLGLQGVQEFVAATPDLEKEWETQFESLQHDLGARQQFARLAAETHRPESLIQESDRDAADIVLRRTAALLADLKRTSPVAPSLAPLGQQLADLQAASAKIAVKNVDARYALFADACRVRRQIAFANPLLSFDQILFIKRHRSSYDHMCDQYYGITVRPGGGLYVLSDPFGPKPQVRDILAKSVVERGRLKGQKIHGGPSASVPVSYDGGGNVQSPDHDGGSFLSPDLSYDGKTILFAYVECKGDRGHRFHTDAAKGHWHEGRCYHVFKANVDGSGLEQLTDGTWNDFDPCWLPNGRAAFISERRGGYLRCGRVCPTYTLYDMAADGSDIRALSFHETNEWHPSVTNDGRIIYTRWDYIDRFGCTAHQPWITTLDGRDSRAVHGNFSPRSSRPDMELDVRAIPGSHKFVAPAAPHHGQAFGSIILIDPWIGDDDKMMPVKRLTPEVGFPESQGGAQVYATPWPLSDDYHLCVYDASMQPGVGFQGGRYFRGNYGIYLVDAFGNKELIYRDPEIACQSPIPLRPTPRPPVMPTLTAEAKDGKRGPGESFIRRERPAEGTLAVINVYDGLMPWPTDTKIKALRVFQILPMSVPSGGPPHEVGFREPSSTDSVNPCRYVLGTVPVEEDGSAYFKVPATKELFFQAIDERGLAVQSMRSATYLQEGERLVCQGCHEPRYHPPQMPKATPLALRREPSRLSPDVDGSNPFSYPRLVQPVLDRNCVECHAKKENTGKAPNLAKEPITRNWYASYANLAQRYGFTSYGGPLRTIPGKFGARASKLYEILQKGHYDVKLSPEEMHRITLWLDSCSLFYGVFEKEGGQAQLRGEVARPTLE